MSGKLRVFFFSRLRHEEFLGEKNLEVIGCCFLLKWFESGAETEYSVSVKRQRCFLG